MMNIFPLELRKSIEEMRKKGMGHKSISKKLGVSRNAIQREIQKNESPYDAEKAFRNCMINCDKNKNA